MSSQRARQPLLILLTGALLLLAQGCFPDFEQFKDFEPIVEEDQGGQPDAADLVEEVTPDVVEDMDLVEEVPDIPDMPDVEDMDLVEEIPDVPDMPDVVDMDVVDVPDVEDMDLVEEVPDIPDMPDVVEDLPDIVEDLPDVEDVPDVEDEPDVIEPPVQIGAACVLDFQCPQGTQCLAQIDDGLCTVACEVDEDCPGDARCGAEAGLPWCLPSCDPGVPEQRCGRIGVARPALDCQPWYGEGGAVCVSDADGDRALNAADNCPAAPNPEQADRDGDALGDACDDLPYCPGAGDGAPNQAPPREVYYNRPSPPAPLQRSGLVYAPPLGSLLALGGLGPESAPVSRVLSYHGAQRAWRTDALPPLPYPAYDVAAAYDLRRGEVVASPGRDAQGRGYSRFLLLDLVDAQGARIEAPAWRLGPILPRTLQRPAMAWLNPGLLLIAGYTPPPEQGQDYRLYAYLYDRASGQVSQIMAEGQGYLPVPPTEIGVLDISAHHNQAGTPYFYITNNLRSGSLVRVNGATGIMAEQLLNPAPFSIVDPPLPPQTPTLAVRGQSQRLYLFRLDNGVGEVVDLETLQAQPSDYRLDVPEPGALDLTQYTWQWRYDPGARSLLELRTGLGEPAATVAREHFLGEGCHSLRAANLYDRDADGRPDLSDNCYAAANLDQSDLDRDALGDVCDLDSDGDGVFNDLEDGDGLPEGDRAALHLDGDNDGIPAAQDADDDNDGLEDRGEDRYPADTDNDGVGNWLDRDDDGDTLYDEDERALGANPQDFLSVPYGERVAYVQLSPEDGARALVSATLRELYAGRAAPMAISAELGLAWPRLAPGGPELVWARGGEQPAVIALNPMISPEPLVAPIAGVRPGAISWRVGLEPPQLAMARQLDQDGQVTWRVEGLLREQLGREGATPFALYETADALVGLDARGLMAVFGRGPVGCEVCQDLYWVTEGQDGATTAEAANLGVQERYPRLGPEGEVLYVATTEDGLRRVWLFVPRGPEAGLWAISPEGWWVNSAAFAPDAQRLLISARPAGEPTAPYQLYLMDRRADRVVQLTRGAASAVEVDQAP
jgi:hypothetical protein